MSMINDASAICTIQLKDSSEIEVMDREVLNTMSVINFCTELGSESFEKAPTVKVDQFPPLAVRFVFEKVLEFERLTGPFVDSTLSKEINELDVGFLRDILEVANFLDCKPVLEFLPVVIAEKVKEMSVAEVMLALGLQEDMEDEEMEPYCAKFPCHQC